MLAFLLVWLALAPQAASTESEQLVWTCPVHREVTEDAPGKCDQCGRDLVETRIRVAYTCPIHSVISQDAPGQCPICGRTLYLASAELAYACPMHPEIRELEPGSCPLCNMALEPETSMRPHQDHNPKHGGLFFMAPDNWHHLEGVYPEEGVFRVYFYDNFSQPLDPSELEARAVLEETFDPDTRKTTELVAFPLVPASDGAYLEASVGGGDLPREITAKVQFEKGGKFDRFDFIFADLSGQGATASAPSTSDVAPGGGVVAPDTAEGIVAAIAERDEKVRELVRTGAFGEVYLPALEAKDLALALEARVGAETDAPLEGNLLWALKQLVRAAWLLDDYGDLGDREKVTAAYDLFEEASKELQGIYKP